MPNSGTPTARRRSGRGWLVTSATIALLGIAAFWLFGRSGSGGTSSSDQDDRTDETAELQIRVQALEADRPLAGTRVRVSGERGLDCAGKTDDLGRAELRECPVGSVRVRFEVAGFVRVTREVTLDPGANELEQVLLPGVRLTGRVLDDRGSPLAGADVAVRPQGDTVEQEDDEVLDPDAREVWHVTAAADGGFAFDTLPEGTFSVHATLAPYESATLPEISAPAAEPIAIVLQRMAAIGGRVLGPTQEPLAAVAVRLAGSGVWPPRTTESNGRGEFRFSAVPAGVYEVRAERGELVSAPLEGVSLDPGEELRIELSLGPGRVLRGQVREASSGRLLAGAQVRVSEDALSNTQKEAVSAGDGSFEFRGLRWLAHLVSVELPGYVSIEARWEPNDPPLRMSLLRAGRIRGRVEDEAGRPVADAELEVVGQSSTGSRLRLQNAAPLLAAKGDPARLGASRTRVVASQSLDNLGVTQGSVPAIPIVPGSGSGPQLGGSPGFRTALNGEFELDGIPPGEFRVIAQKSGFVTSGSGAFVLGPGAVRHDVRLVLGRGGSVVGRVIDEAGQPMPGVRVSLAAGTEPLRWTLTDETGGFEFLAVQGRGSLVAQPLEGASNQRDIDIAAGARLTADIVLETSRATLTGRVLDTLGDPVAGARVRIEAARFSTTALAARDGTFEFAGLPAPPYTLRAEHVDYAAGLPVAVDTRDRPVQLVLDAGHSVEGLVLDLTSHDPIPGATISLRRGSHTETTRTNGEGAFEFPRVAAGPYQLAADAEAHVSQSRAIEVGGRRDPNRAEERFYLEGAGSLSGEVVDRLGVPVWNAEVAPGEPADWSRAVRTDHEGHFEVPGLRPGAAQLTARKASVEPISLTARVHEGVESPGVVLRFAGVVEAPEVEEPEPSRNGSRAKAAPVDGPATSPLTLGRSGDLVLVERVAPGSPADRLGLRTGDVLTAINGETVRSPAQARGMLGLPPGPHGWLIELQRDGEKLRLRYSPH